MYSKSFTLTLLGTDTVYTPTLRTQKKTVLKHGDRLAEYFPKGETLSIVSSLIKTEEILSETTQAIPYRADSIAVVNGPSTEGKNVGEKIGIGLGLVLNAIARGNHEINEIAHSRGGVEALLIAHELNAIKEIMATNVTFEKLIEQLILQQNTRHTATPYNNTPDIIDSLLKQIPQTKEDKNLWFTSLKTHISKVSMNLFIIDPVPGDCWPITWYDERYFTLPAVVKNAEFVYYEDERSYRGFTPIYCDASMPYQQVVRNTMSGHHGTGSAGSNASQQNIIVSPESTKATHVQKLLIFKLFKFLSASGVEFNDASAIFQMGKGLGRKHILSAEDKESKDIPIDISKLNFPRILRQLYNEIFKNRSAYEAFHQTSYIAMGLGTQRQILRSKHKYSLLTEAFPHNKGYINEEHSQLMKEHFFQLFQIDFDNTQTLSKLIQSVQTVLSENIKQPQILNNAQIREDVLNSFSAVIQRVGQQYLTDDWSTPSKQQEKQELFTAITNIFAEFKRLSQTKDFEPFVESLRNLSITGIIQTYAQQYANLEAVFNRLDASIDKNMHLFFNELLVQNNIDANNLNLTEIMENPGFAQLPNYPIKTKLAYIHQQLTQVDALNDYAFHTVEQLFEEQYSNSIEGYSKLHHQIQVFIQDTSALSHFFSEQESFFNKHELLLRKKSSELIDMAAQKFYRDQPLDTWPKPVANSLFNELVEHHAVAKYGIVDRKQQLITHLNDEKEAEHLLLIKKQLIPLTQNYLSSLRAESSKDPEKIEDKIKKVQLLSNILQDTQNIPSPKERFNLFYRTLDANTVELASHHDREWKRYCKNAVIAAGILLTGLIPGLLALAVYTQIGHSFEKSILFWQSSGKNAICSLNQYRTYIDVPESAEADLGVPKPT